MSNRCVIPIVLLLVIIIQQVRGPANAAEPKEMESYAASSTNSGLISAPVTYKDLMLIATTPDGVAAIVFGDRVENGTNYRFRYLKRDAIEEVDGEGVVFEKYTDGKYDGGTLTIKAGAIRIGWSRGDDKCGWIYYEPEKMRVSIASAVRFGDHDKAVRPSNSHVEKLDLKRFVK